jgi:hypothetical protein
MFRSIGHNFPTELQAVDLQTGILQGDMAQLGFGRRNVPLYSGSPDLTAPITAHYGSLASDPGSVALPFRSRGDSGLGH